MYTLPAGAGCVAPPQVDTGEEAAQTSSLPWPRAAGALLLCVWCFPGASFQDLG